MHSIMNTLRPYTCLMRLDRPIGTWLLLLPGWWAIALASFATAGEQAGAAIEISATNATGASELSQSIESILMVIDWWLMMLFGIGALVMRGAGCVINDLWDRDLDKQVERTRSRPLASGALSLPQALMFLAILLLIGLIILLQFNPLTICLGIISMVFVATYPLMKRITWWPQAFLGLTFNFGALMGWAAVTGELGLTPVLIYIAGIFWTLGYDTIYALQDREDDMIAGIKSSARYLTERCGAMLKPVLYGFYTLHFGILMAAILTVFDPHILMILCVIPYVHLVWQVKTVAVNDTGNALMRFKSNRDYGLLILGCIVLMFVF